MSTQTTWTEADHENLLYLSSMFQLKLAEKFPGRDLQVFVAVTLGTFGELVRQAEDPEVLQIGLNQQLSDTQYRLIRVG